MNILSYKEAMLADSVMKSLYNSILIKIDSNIDFWKKDMSSDTAGINYELRLRDAMIIGQTKFEEYRGMVTKIPDIAYEGGSDSPLMSNSYYEGETINRIKLLEAYWDEIFNR